MSKFPRAAIVSIAAIAISTAGCISLAPSVFAHTEPLTAATMPLARGSVSIGMTKEQVLAALGKPTQKTGEFWVWLRGNSGYGVTFKNGKVIRCGALEG